MNNISCIFCGKPSEYVAIRENGYTGRKCDECSLIFISPRPSATEVLSLYENEHAFEEADNQLPFEKANSLWAAVAIARIRKYRKAGSILELGSGSGAFLLEAQRCGYEPYGIEPNPIEARWINIRLQIPCETQPLSRRSFSGMQFDVVYHKDVLSHLYDPIVTFSEINRALKANGLLVFETSNIADLSDKYYKLFSQFSYPDHLFFFGEKSIAALLERTGFDCVRTYREPILLHLVLQKLLWALKDLLKDRHRMPFPLSNGEITSVSNLSFAKRQLRVLYRYVNYYLIRLGLFLPKKGSPLKLLLIAQKKRTAGSPLAFTI